MKRRKGLILRVSQLLREGNSDGKVLSQITNPLDSDFDLHFFNNILSIAKRYNLMYYGK